jgi:hypothetical protein
MLEAWGNLGEAKPPWFDVAFYFACPGIFLCPIPIVGPLVLGGDGWLPSRLASSSASGTQEPIVIAHRKERIRSPDLDAALPHHHFQLRVRVPRMVAVLFIIYEE